SQLEFDRDLYDDIDRRTVTMRRRELPLTHRLHGAIVQSTAQALQNPDVADRAVAPHDDLQHHFAAEPAAPRVFCVVGADFAQQPRRIDSAPRTEWSAAGAASGSRSNAGPVALANARSRAGTGAAAFTGPMTLVVRRRLFEHADPRPVVRGRRDDRRDDDRELLRFQWRLGFRLRRIRRDDDRLRLAPLRQRATDRPASFAHRLRRRRFLQPPAAS